MKNVDSLWPHILTAYFTPFVIDTFIDTERYNIDRLYYKVVAFLVFFPVVLWIDGWGGKFLDTIPIPSSKAI